MASETKQQTTQKVTQENCKQVNKNPPQPLRILVFIKATDK